MVFFKVLSYLPFWVLYGIADLLYYVLYYVVRYRRRVVRQNLTIAFPNRSEAERQQIERTFYRHLTDLFVEILKGLSISPEALSARCRLVNPELITQYTRKGQTVLVMTSHTCNWEWQSLRLGLEPGVQVDVIYKNIRNDFFDDLMFAIRSRFGILPVPQQQTIRELIKRRAIPKAVGLVADQAPEHIEMAYWSTFLGRPTDFYVGTEKLALSYGYPVVFVWMKRIRRGYYEIVFSDLAQPPYPSKAFSGEISERYVRALEHYIEQQPADWLWSHNRWKRSANTTLADKP